MFKILKSVFNIRPAKFLGIDVGTSFIRVVEIERHGREYHLSNYGEFDESSFKFGGSKGSIFFSSNKNIASAIRLILDEAEIRTKEVNFSIPDFSSFFTSFELPLMEKKEIPKAVRYQMRPFVPLPLDEIDFDWSIIEGQPSKTPIKVLVMAVPKEIVVQYRKVAELAGLELRCLESEVFALARALIDKRTEEEGKVIGLIDIGAWTTTCSVIENGIVKNSYSFNIAGNEFTKIIDRSLNVEYNKAEELKKKYGLSLLLDAGLNVGEMNQEENLIKKNVFKILVPLTDSILREVKKVFRDFYRVEGKEVDKVILSGGTCLMPGLREYFRKELKREVDMADPFAHLVYPPVLAKTLESMKSTYGIAVGLALKGFE